MIPRFTGPLRSEQIGSELWKVEAFSFIDSEGRRHDIFGGFETDMASSPAVTQGIVPRCSYYSQAAVMHDLFYYRHRNGLDTTLTRLDADNIFLEGIKVTAALYNVSDMERKDWLLYGGVRIGGLSSWETPAEKKERLEMINSHITDED